MVQLCLKKATCMMVLICAAALASAQNFKTVVNFSKGNGEMAPYGPLIQGTDGNFYGTTEALVPVSSLGKAYKLTASGDLTTLYSFCSQENCTDGAFPSGALVQAGNGNFYGVTYEGGSRNDGTIYELTPAGELTTLYSFCSQTNCVDGKGPVGGMIQGTDGNFYGTTRSGGAAGYYGTIFKITPSRQLTSLYSFCSQANCADGDEPQSSLVQASNGNFYGTTTQGGVSSYCVDPAIGCGTIFEITPVGKFTTLYTFCSQPNCADGDFPYSGLIQASDGNLYGTTYQGGANGNDGTVFEITTSGKLTTLYSFCAQSGCADGASPSSGLVQGSNGNLYGTTEGGGVNCFGAYCGTAYEITTKGNLTTLHTFNPPVQGANPSSILQATDGVFYGLTTNGGKEADGTVFTLSQ
jgi:uncharacterized repeat protein (TIGR03803 family)